MLATYASLPKERSHGDYLAVGLLGSLICVAGAFIIPLGSDPSLCHDAITPNNLHSDTSCACTGLLLEVGAIGSVYWGETCPPNTSQSSFHAEAMSSAIEINQHCAPDHR